MSALILIVIGCFIVLAVRNPAHAKKVFAGVGQVVQKVGSIATTAPAASTGGPGWLKRNQWAILVAGAALAYWGFHNAQIRPADAWSWSWKHWLPLLLLWGVGAALVAINAKGTVAKTLQWVLVGVMFVLFIGFPMVSWLWGEKPSPQPAIKPASVRMDIPLASMPQSSWLRLALSAGVGEKSKLIPVPPNMHVVAAGNKFRLHNVYQDGRECAFGDPCVAGPLAGVYATNEAGEANIVAYAFAPD